MVLYSTSLIVQGDAYHIPPGGDATALLDVVRKRRIAVKVLRHRAKPKKRKRKDLETRNADLKEVK